MVTNVGTSSEKELRVKPYASKTVSLTHITMSSDILIKVAIESGANEKLVFKAIPKYKFEDTSSFNDYLLYQEQEFAKEEGAVSLLTMEQSLTFNLMQETRILYQQSLYTSFLSLSSLKVEDS